MERYENFDHALAKRSSQGFLSAAMALAAVFVVIFVRFGINSLSEKTFETTRALQVVRVPGQDLASRQIVVEIDGKFKAILTSDPKIFIRAGDIVCLLRSTNVFGRKQYSVWPPGFCPQMNR